MREIFDRDTERGESIADIVRALPAKGLLTRTGKHVRDRSTVWACCATPPTADRQSSARRRPPASARSPATRSPTAVSATAAARPDAMSRPSSGPASPPRRYHRGDRRARPGAPTGEQDYAKRDSREPRAAEGILVCRDCGYACWRTSARTSRRRLYSYRCIGSDNCRHGACARTGRSAPTNSTRSCGPKSSSSCPTYTDQGRDRTAPEGAANREPRRSPPRRPGARTRARQERR